MKFLTAVITLWLVIHHLQAQNNTHRDPVRRQPSDSSASTSIKEEVSNAEDMIALKSIFDRYNMDGTIIIFDPSSGKYSGYNSARWDSGYLPASTFKIPNTLIGKTGWAVRNGNNYGWFVGWIETKGNVYYLATLVEPKNQKKVTDFALARKTVTLDVLRFYRLIP